MIFEAKYIYDPEGDILQVGENEIAYVHVPCGTCGVEIERDKRLIDSKKPVTCFDCKRKHQAFYDQQTNTKP